MGPKGVRVNTLVPGFFPAEQNRKVLDPSRVQSILGHTPMQRFGEPDELIGATLLLASRHAAGFITGLNSWSMAASTPCPSERRSAPEFHLQDLGAALDLQHDGARPRHLQSPRG